MIRNRVGRLVVMAWLVVLTAGAWSAGDPYLDALEAESGKVEAGTPVERNAVAQQANPGASREEFEAQLRSRYAGSFVFYKRLAERDRQEVFSQFVAGASIEDIRKTIVARFLQK